MGVDLLEHSATKQSMGPARGLCDEPMGGTKNDDTEDGREPQGAIVAKDGKGSTNMCSSSFVRIYFY
jgi:hypothetical protein